MPIRVFHVDDNPDETTLLQYLLAGRDDIEHVGSVNAADDLLPALVQIQPDVLILDYRLGLDVNTEDLVRQVTKECPGTSVVCLTGYDNPEAADLMKACGVVAHVTKSSPFETLLEAISAASRREARTSHRSEHSGRTGG